MSKIFCLGLGRTGTRSLTKALNILGIKAIHWPVDKKTYLELSSGNYQLSVLKEYDALLDITTAPIYPMLDYVYPKSKFILTYRKKDEWVKSMIAMNEHDKLFLNKNIIQKFITRFKDDLKRYWWKKALQTTWWHIKRHKAIEFAQINAYGALAYQDLKYFEIFYDFYHSNVRNYFKDRPNDYLEMDITQGEGWEKLCPFLNKDIPQEPFPHLKEQFRKRAGRSSNLTDIN